MKRKQFLTSLGIIVGSGMIIPELKSERLTLPTKNSNSDMTFGVNGIERLRITNNGNVCLGTNTPSTKLIIS